MLMGQYSVVLCMFPLKLLSALIVALFVSLFMIRINSPLGDGALKKRLHELIVFPGFKSMSKLDPGPSSGRNFSCSWLLQKISFLVGASKSSGKSKSLSVQKRKKKTSITVNHHY